MKSEEIFSPVLAQDLETHTNNQTLNPIFIHIFLSCQARGRGFEPRRPRN